MSFRIQEFLHKYELGAGAAIIRFALVIMAVIALAIIYDLSAFHNLSTSEGMDAAQLARNLSEGKGFTTGFIRPLSLSLITKKNLDQKGGTRSSATNKVSVAFNHPDLANAPLYPAILAAALKLNPFGEPDFSKEQSFSVYRPDLWIAFFNQLLFAIAAWMLFRLTRRLLDESVAWAVTLLFLLTELLWRFTLSGLSTILLIIIFLGLVGTLSRMETVAREPSQTGRSLIWLAAAAGALTGAAGMTRYSFACLIVPVVLLLVSLPSPQRVQLVIICLAAFCVVSLPWAVRNFQASGNPWGTAGFAVMEGTSLFPENQLLRSLHPPVSQVNTGEYWDKLVTNTQHIVTNDLPRLGGNWISALFLAGLLVRFRNPVLGRMRLFVILCLGCLVTAQALGKTWLSDDSPDVNSENLLVVLAPVVFLFGTTFFFTVRDQLNLQGPVARGLLWVAFYAVMATPLVLGLLGPHRSALVYPPYYPPWIEQKSRVVGEDQAVMSDIPWAVAWYGKRPGVWLSLKYIDTRSEAYKDDFFAIKRLQRISALYLTSKTLKTMDIKSLADWARAETFDKDLELVRKMVTDLGQALVRDNAKQAEIDQLKAIYSVVDRNWVRGGGNDWESFILGIFVKKEVPSGFPLNRAVGGIAPEVFLTESER